MIDKFFFFAVLNSQFLPSLETKKEADEKLFEKQWNTDDRRGARVGMWQDFQDDKKRSANVKRQRTAVNFKREEKQETKKKYGEWDRESWRRDWK